MADQQRERSWLTEGVMLAGLTLAGYVVAFAYEARYASHFGVPFDLIVLDLTTILTTMGALLALAWFIVAVLTPVSSVLGSERLPRPLRERLGNLLARFIHEAVHEGDGAGVGGLDATDFAALGRQVRSKAGVSASNAGD